MAQSLSRAHRTRTQHTHTLRNSKYKYTIHTQTHIGRNNSGGVSRLVCDDKRLPHPTPEATMVIT